MNLVVWGGVKQLDHREYVMNFIKTIDESLAFEHGTPDHNNKEDPLDELIFIQFSRRTRSSSYETVYDELRSRYLTWEDVLYSNDVDLFKIVNRAGFGSKRVKELKNNLKNIKEKFGVCSLERLKKWRNSKVFSFLTSLEGIGPKSAFCVMMFSLKRNVFPMDSHVLRICRRLGIIDEDIDRKKAQMILAEVFPEKLRYSLHVNMISHGREICKSKKPICENCIIAGFCKYTREKTDKQSGPGFLDLFSGAGGMSLGFEKEGFNLIKAVEFNKKAASTFYYNRLNIDSDKIYNGDIKELDPDFFSRRDIDLIVAGPPCQEFSKVRKNGFGENERKELYKEVLRFIEAILPRYVVIENVPGMASHINKDYVLKVEEGLRKLNYVVNSDLINARHYGIPQNRIRLFFIARRIYGGAKERAEKELNRIWNNIKNSNEKKEISFKQGISGLPKINAGEGSDIFMVKNRGIWSNYAISLGNRYKPVFNHKARIHNPDDLKAYAIMDEGENALDLYKKDPSLMKYSTSSFPTKYYKIKSDSPSPTIVAHLRKDANSFIHPFNNRGITPREAARLQSFPDNYRFLGSFGLQFEQIGNAVPPRLAEVIASAIINEFR